MAVTNETIIKKMMQELQRAQEKNNNHVAITHHISNIQLLCDLILEESSEPINTREISDQEMKAMIGSSNERKNNNNYETLKAVNKENNDSIFDF